MKLAGKILVCILAGVGLVSLGVDWREGNLGFFRWNLIRTNQDIPGNLIFQSASLTYSVSDVKVKGTSFINEGEATWKFLNFSEKPVTIVFPPQKYSLQIDEGTSRHDLPESLVNAGTITLAPKEAREFHFPVPGGSWGKLPRLAAFHVAAQIDGTLTILAESRVEIGYR